MRNPLTIFTGTPGLNNRVDPVRLKIDRETGIAELAEAANVTIDDTGRVSRRPGSTIEHLGVYHSIFCDKGDCFVVKDRTSDAAIYQIGTDKSLTGVRSGLQKGERISFCQVGSKTYYSSRYQNGVIEGGISTSWPGYTHVGTETQRVFYPAPLGSHIAYFKGCMWIADGAYLWVSEPYAVGKFRLAARGFPFPSDIRMVKPVTNGVWVSDSEKTGFIPASDKFEEMRFAKRSSFPAHEWSEAIELVDLSKTSLQLPGQSAIWSSDAGLNIGTEDGQLMVTTEAKLIYPTGAKGATLVDGHTAINTIY